MRHILILLICCLASVSAQAIGVDKDRLNDRKPAPRKS